MPRYLTPTNVPELLQQGIQHSGISNTVFTEKYPDEAVTVPTIVWSIARRVPGKEGKETRKPRLREEDRTRPDRDILYFGQWTTVIYQFDLYHSSDQEVNRLMEGFERFLLEATPALVNAGVETFIFDEQLKDYAIPPTPKDTAVRSLRYMAIFTTVYPVYMKRIGNIKMIINMDRTLESLALTRGTTDTDLLPTTEIVDDIEVTLRIERVYAVSDLIVTSGILPDYIKDVDYYVAWDDTSRQVSIVWLDSGKQPTAGATYYVHYDKITEYLETDLLETSMF